MIEVNGETVTREKLHHLMTSEYHLPEYMVDGMWLYLEHHISPGSFMQAVLCNDLQGACTQADSTNRHCIFEWVQFLYNEIPGNAYGSSSAFLKWLEKRKL